MYFNSYFAEENEIRNQDTILYGCWRCRVLILPFVTRMMWAIYCMSYLHAHLCTMASLRGCTLRAAQNRQITEASSGVDKTAVQHSSCSYSVPIVLFTVVESVNSTPVASVRTNIMSCLLPVSMRIVRGGATSNFCVPRYYHSVPWGQLQINMGFSHRHASSGSSCRSSSNYR